jgi:hypothetical protein
MIVGLPNLFEGVGDFVARQNHSISALKKKTESG